MQGRLLVLPTLAAASALAIAARPAHSLPLRGECDPLFSRKDATLVLGLRPWKSDEEKKSGTYRCVYGAYGYTAAKRFVNASVTVRLDYYPDKERARDFAKKVCATDNEEACKLAEEIVREDDPLRRFKLGYRELGELGKVKSLTGKFGKYQTKSGTGWNPAYIWEPDFAHGWVGDIVYVYLPARERVLTALCWDASLTANTQMRAPQCAFKAAHLAYLNTI